ncbi:PQQ-like beta-propeller repeat protein, partial [Verrucomicrobia bacterium]|nr:PQQ-like beta-propeller repeat protein [Verrucomicrobiota bacterium]
MKKSLLKFVLVGSLLPVFSITADEWPQFLGPDRNAVSQEKGLATSWPKSGPKELWAHKLGQGFGGAAVRDGKVYLLDRADSATEVFRVLDLKNGKELWSYSYKPQLVKLPFPGSRSTPTLDGNFAYIVGRVGDITCINLKTQKAAWHHNMREKYDIEATARWGYSQSPLVYKNLVIAAVLDDSDGYLIGFDKKTGKEVWKTGNVDGANYVSPRLYTIHGVEQILMYGRGDKSRKEGRWFSVNPTTGKQLWSYDGYFNSIMIPSPTDIGDGRLFISGGYGAGTVMIQVSHRGGKWTTKELFWIEGEGTQIHQPILHDGYLYANWNTNENLKKGKKHLGGLACISLQGKVVWRTGEDPSFDRGNVIMAGGKLFVLDGELGELVMVDPSAKGYKELARAKVFSDLKPKKNLIWAPMALANGKLIVRSQ